MQPNLHPYFEKKLKYGRNDARQLEITKCSGKIWNTYLYGGARGRLYKRFIPQICGEKWIYRTKTSTIVCAGEGTVDFKVVEGETCFSHIGYLD